MNISTGFFLLCAVAAPLGLSARPPVRPQADDPNRMTVMWSDPSRPGLLKVNLLSGGITVKTHEGQEVIIEARAGRRRRPAPAESAGLRRIDTGTAGLIVEEENNVMSVGTNWFSFNSADITIQVPARTNLSLKTLNGGNILVDGVEGEIEVTNLNGGVTLNNVAGSVVAHSMNGKVVAALRQVTENKPMAFTSMNGSIDVTLPASAKANLKMRTDNGEVYSDFEIERKASPPLPLISGPRNRNGRQRLEIGTNMYGAINSGGPDFDLRTFNGNIYIRKAAK
jgi:Toastrack DUF4097